jgi:hypothetical protein
VSVTVRRILFTLGYVAAALIAVTAVGFLNYRMLFFRWPETMLSFSVLGLMAALIYASVQMRGLVFAVVVIAFWCLVRAALNGDLLALAGPATYALPIGFSLVAASYVQKSLTRLKFGRFLPMGVIVGVGYALYMFSRVVMGEGSFGAIWHQTVLGAEAGAAMGLGFELIDLIGPRPAYEPD